MWVSPILSLAAALEESESLEFDRMRLQIEALYASYQGKCVVIGACVWFELSDFHFRVKRELWESLDPEGPMVCL